MNPEFWAGRRVLVTGHTGFKGAWLSLWLARMGAEVTGVSAGVPTQPSLFALARVEGDVTHVEADIRDYEALREAVAAARPDVVFHMAAQAIVRRSFDDPRETYETNVMGTVNVFEAVRVTGGAASLVNVTSDKCYENREWDWGYREHEPKGGYDPYSSSKGAAELVTDAYRRSFLGPLASARAGNVIGGGDWAEDRILPDAVRAADAGEPLVVRDPAAIRPWQHVLNPLSGYLVLAERLASGEAAAARAWNFAPGLEDDQRPVSWLVERFGAALGVPLEVTAPARADGPREAARLGLDPTRAARELSWRERWPLERGLAETADWYRRVVFEGADARTVTLSQIRAFGPPA